MAPVTQAEPGTEAVGSGVPSPGSSLCSCVPRDEKEPRVPPL